MGHGIAQVFARAGHRVASLLMRFRPRSDTVHARIESNLRDLAERSGLLPLVSGRCRSRGGALQGADFVFEAAPENLDAEAATIFADLEQLARADAILASQHVRHPDRHDRARA